MTTSSEERNDEIDGRELIAALWGRRWLITVSVVLCTAIFAGFAYFTTPVYRASAILIPANTNRGDLRGSFSSALGSVGGLAALAGINLPSGDSAVEEALAVLRSRQFTESFISDNNVMVDLFADDWDDRSKKWKVNSGKQPTLNQAFRRFDGLRTITKDTKTGLISIQIDWKDRLKATEWTNELIQRLNMEMRTRAIANADASLGYLQKELAATSDVGTREAVNRLIEAQIQQHMLANVTQEYVLRFVDKAMIPDATDPVWPRKVLLIAIGLVIGAVVGVAAAIFVHARELAAGKHA